YMLQSVVVPLLFSMLIAITLFPLSTRLERWRIPRLLAAIISVIVAIIVVFGLIYLIINQVLNIGRNGEDMAARFQAILAVITQWCNANFGITDDMLSQKYHEFTDDALYNATYYLQRASISIGGILSSVLLVPLFVFFMLFYRDFFNLFFFLTFQS